MLFLLLLVSFVFNVVSGSPAMQARQTDSTPTACPATAPATATWIPAATDVAAIPKGAITDCQLGCLGKWLHPKSRIKLIHLRNSKC